MGKNILVLFFATLSLYSAASFELQQKDEVLKDENPCVDYSCPGGASGNYPVRNSSGQIDGQACRDGKYCACSGGTGVQMACTTGTVFNRCFIPGNNNLCDYSNPDQCTGCPA